jgi:alkylation response protein AidB-like acyl-CoA dehydrogenase
MSDKNELFGAEFLIRDFEIDEIFISEEFDEEQLMIAQTCEDFIETEIVRNLDRIDAQEEGLMPQLLQKAGALGLLGISIPEEFEGFDQSFLTTMRANEVMGKGSSFSVAFMAHTGIGTLPLLYYGNEEQKRKYIPALATGSLSAAYCLTEPNAGSDANAGKSKAVLSEDGKHYILNGQKMWITNGGFADILTVFAKIDNDRVLSAFIVERKWEGISFNPEEKKMGIKGSSTRQIFFNDVKVPVENLLGKRGEGFRIALNILHIGRIKLGVNVLGASKVAINHAVNYANERKQFGALISEFGAIKYKLSEQVIRTFATESAVYRASKDIDRAINTLVENGMEKGKANVEGSSRFAVECALLKVYGSECLDYVVDEAVQIYGGMGFSAETPVDRAYRDSRINRIFEGTNEINRLLVVDTALKTAMKGAYSLFEKAEEVFQNMDALRCSELPEGYYEEKYHRIRNFKHAILMIIDAAYRNMKKQFFTEQEIMMNLSDMIMQVYVAESTFLRVKKLESKGSNKPIEVIRAILDVLLYDSACIIQKEGLEAIHSFAEEREGRNLTDAIYAFTKVASVNVKEQRRCIANYLIEENTYKL